MYTVNMSVKTEYRREEKKRPQPDWLATDTKTGKQATGRTEAESIGQLVMDTAHDANAEKVEASEEEKEEGGGRRLRSALRRLKDE